MTSTLKQIIGGTKDEASMTPDQMAKFYIEEGLKFEKGRYAEAVASKKLAWRCFAGAMVLVGVTVIGSAVNTFYHKPNPPGILQVADTGDVTWLKTLSDAKVTYNQATDVSYLRKYINCRESYDWETIQDFFNCTMLLSSSTEGAIYAQFNNEQNPNSPVNVLKNHARVIATPGTISWVGKTALVSFSKKTILLNQPGSAPTVEYFVATINFKYEDQPMDDRDRGINVAGFKATSYTVARDLTKAAAIKIEGSAP